MKLRGMFAVPMAATLVVGGAVAFASPASAQFTTRCVGVGGAVTVPGDLYVPEGQSCVLNGTTVNGNVEVHPDADLVVNGGTLNGDVEVQPNGYFDAIETAVSGDVEALSAFGTYVEDSTTGSVSSDAAEAGDSGGFVIADDTSVGGSVTAQIGELFVDGSSVDGNLVSAGTEYTDVYDTEVEGNLRAEGVPFGVVVCESEVYGDARFFGNSGPVQIGGAGPLTPCEGASFYNGNVVVEGNTAPTYVDNNIIRGDLVARGNSPVTEIGALNRVRGSIIGDEEDLAQTLAAVADEDPREEAEELAEERHDEAVEDAEEAGPAF